MSGPILPDPTAALFLPGPPGPAIPLRYRTGRLTSWEVSTGENTVEVDGVEFTNVAVLPGAYLATLADGDLVAMISTSDERGVATYAIFGLALAPPSYRVGRSAGRLGFAKLVKGVNTLSTNTTSGSYGDISGAQLTRMVKIASDTNVEIEMTGSCFALTSTAGVAFGVQVDGGTTYDCFRFSEANPILGAHSPWAGGNLITGLTAGEHLFQPQWARISGTGTVHMNDGDQLTMTIREVAP